VPASGDQRQSFPFADILGPRIVEHVRAEKANCLMQRRAAVDTLLEHRVRMKEIGITEPHFQLSSGGLVRLILQRAHRTGAGEFSYQTQMLFAITILWLPLVVLTLIADTFVGNGVAKPFINDLVPQVRFLIALPLLLLADMAIDPAVAGAIRNLQASGVVPASEQSRFKAALTKLAQHRDSVWPDVVMLVLAFSITWLFQPGYGASAIETADTSWLRSISDGNVTLSTAGWWYVLVSGPLFQFILFRWMWRFLIWADFLRRVSRVSLALHATHPDLSGGIGVLGLVQQTFVVVFVAFGAIMSSTIAHNIMFEGDSFKASRPEIIVFVIACVVVIYAPLLFFSGQMYRERRIGLSQYGALGHRLSEAFYATWIKGAGSDVGTALKEAIDPSAMADYGATFDIVRSMRAIPVSLRSIVTVAAILTIPFMPLSLTEFSITDLLQRMADALV
jgi:hypothetical protein